MVRLITAIAVLGLAWGFILPSQLQARPVSYQGGWTFIEETDRQSSSVLVHYTVNPKVSLGWRSEIDRQSDQAFHGGQGTFLAKRWFGENFQANLYAQTGVGFTEGFAGNNADPALAGFVGLLADWETRRLFVSYRGRLFDAEGQQEKPLNALRFGVAPYIGNTGDLHSWLMIEIDHRPENTETFGVTPLIRLFKGGALFEAGWSVTDDEPLINFTYRF